MTPKELEAIEEREWWNDGTFKGDLRKDVESIVAEAERRGERRAWEEARDIVMDEAVGYTEEALATDGMGKISAEFKSEALRFIQGVFDAKLNALK